MHSQMGTSKDFFKLALQVIKRKKIDRNTLVVTNEYTDTWNSYRDKLNNSRTIDEWLNDNDGQKRYYNVKGKFSKQVFDSSDFYRKAFLAGFEKYFKNSKTVAEF